MRIRNFAGGVAIALLLTLPLVKPVIVGVDTWKIVLGVGGLILFVSAGLMRTGSDA